MIVVGFEAVAGAKVITYWLPGLPLWLLSLVLMLLMTATNLFSVKSFGEFEFWFAGIKVGAIVLFLVIGGVIGAGLFVGSGVVIKDAGPGAFLTYLLTGVMIIMVMRMLGEMATANPSTGSFADYARKAMGGWAGFSVG